MRIDSTADALADFGHISTWIENEQSLALANRTCRRIYDTVQALRRQPSLGRIGRVAGTRELVVIGTPWIAIYRANSDVKPGSANTPWCSGLDILRLIPYLAFWFVRTGPHTRAIGQAVGMSTSHGV